MPSTLRFTAPMYSVGINRCVDVPPRVSRALGDGTRIYVQGSIEGMAFRSTLMPRGQGKHRLFVHSRVWRPLALTDGCRVRVEVTADREGSVVEVPLFLQEALDRRPRAAQRFAGLPPATQREMVSWLHAARRPETRERRIELALERLEADRLREG